jgi:hypothetical protein
MPGEVWRVFGTERWVGVLLEFLLDGATVVVSRMVPTTENTSDIIRAFRSVTVLCGAITCAFDASWFEMAVVLCVHIFDSWSIEQYPVCAWEVQI